MDYLRLRLCVFALLTTTEASANSNLIDSMVTSLCGPKLQCLSNNSVDHSLEVFPCCLPCECDELCKERDTCCQQPDPEDLYNVTKQTCMPAARLTEANVGITTVPEYFVRDRCPEGFSNLEVKQKCETDIPLHMEDVPFVSSQSGDIIYKNRHCASCHGESNTVKWDVIVDKFCIKEIYWSIDSTPVNISEIENILLTCTLPFKRPNNVNWRRLFCTKNLKGTCESTFNDKTLATDLEHLCSNSTDLRPFIGRKMYRNVYCFICNQATVEMDVCTQDPFRMDRSIFFLLNVDTVTNAEMTKDRRCRPDEIYDSFFKKCRMLFCPLFSIANENSCQSLATFVNANYELQFKLVPEMPFNLEEYDMQLLVSEIPKRVKTLYRLGKCQACLVRIFTSLAPGNASTVKSFYLQTVLKSDEHCPQKSILEVAKTGQISKQYLMYRSKNKTLLFTTKYLENLEESTKNETLIKSYSKKAADCLYFKSNRLENCAKVSLSFNEMAFIENVTNSQNLRKTIKNDAVQVCMEDYFHLTGQYVSGSTIWTVSVTMTTVFMTLTLGAT